MKTPSRQPTTTMSTTATLRLCSVQLSPANQYEPRHTRATYFDTETRTFIARATIGTEVIVEVEHAKDYEADSALASRLIEIFRALRSAA